MVGVEQDEGEGPLEQRQHVAQRVLERAVVGPVVDACGDEVPVGIGTEQVDNGLGREARGEQLGHEVAVGGHHPGQHAGLLGQLGGVGEVAVVAEGEAGPAHGTEDGLGVAPLEAPVVE